MTGWLELNSGRIVQDGTVAERDDTLLAKECMIWGKKRFFNFQLSPVETRATVSPEGPSLAALGICNDGAGSA